MPSSPPSIPEGRVASFANDAHLQDYRITEVLPRQVWRVRIDLGSTKQACGL
ncbi:MAG UNVERIFIED_CONTAM: hypothetical protein LVT10_16335 [Anaerolineae bacterium]